MSSTVLEMVLVDELSPDAIDAWKLCEASLEQAGFLDAPLTTRDGKVLQRGALERRLKSSKRGGLDVRSSCSKVDYARIGVRELSIVYIETTRHLPHSSGDALVTAFEPCGLVYARCYDAEFEYWQNAKDPVSFELAGRATSQLKIERDPDIPDRMVVRTRENPGRTVWGLRWKEAVGHVMWLPNRFWSSTNGSRAESEQLAESVDAVASDVCRFTFQGEHFTEHSRAATIDTVRTAVFGQGSKGQS
jgi:hypothetical protein